MDIQAFLNPWLMSSGFGAVIGIGVLVIIWRGWSAVVQFCKDCQARLFTRAGLFWAVNLVFMAVSVLHAGAFFGVTGNAHDVPGFAQYLGFAVSFFLDLVTLVLMQAMLEARYRGEESKAKQLLLFIVLCCATSTFANLAISLNDFSAAVMLPHAPYWVQLAAPYVLASFPLFIIMMAIAAELIVNVRPLDSLNEQEYEDDEKKRINILEIRNLYFEKQVNAELRMLQIRAKRQSDKAVARGWRYALPWVKDALDLSAVAAEAAKQLDAKFVTLVEQNERLINQMQGQVDVNGLIAGAVDPLVSQILALSDLNQQVSRQLQAIQQDNKPLDVAALVGEITGQIEVAYAARFRTLETENQRLNEQLSSLISEVQALDFSPDTDEISSVKASYSEVLINDIQSLVIHYPILQRWLSESPRTVTIEDIIEVTGHSKKMVTNRINDHTFTRTRRRGYYRVDSIIRWLKTAPLPKMSRGDTSVMEAVVPAANGHGKDTVKLDQLESVLPS